MLDKKKLIPNVVSRNRRLERVIAYAVFQSFPPHTISPMVRDSRKAAVQRVRKFTRY